MGINKVVHLLNYTYAVERYVEADLRGYVLIAENILDIEILKLGKLQGLLPEYTDIITCSEGVNYTLSLFLLSCDFSIILRNVGFNVRYCYIKSNLK